MSKIHKTQELKDYVLTLEGMLYSEGVISEKTATFLSPEEKQGQSLV